MNSNKTLIVCDEESKTYWKSITEEMELKHMEKVCIVQNDGFTEDPKLADYSLIVLDISNLEDLSARVEKLHLKLPESRILVTSSVPTWKLTREMFKLGASNLIRKTYDKDEIIDELRAFRSG